MQHRKHNRMQLHNRKQRECLRSCTAHNGGVRRKKAGELWPCWTKHAQQARYVSEGATVEKVLVNGGKKSTMRRSRFGRARAEILVTPVAIQPVKCHRATHETFCQQDPLCLPKPLKPLKPVLCLEV